MDENAQKVVDASVKVAAVTARLLSSASRFIGSICTKGADLGDNISKRFNELSTKEETND